MKLELNKTNRQNIEDIYPLSPMQEGMLFESLYAPDSGVYFESLIYTLKGNVDVPAFEQAWQQVVAKYSIFRTAFVWESLSQPIQVVYRQVDVTLLTQDWRELSVDQQQQQLETFVSTERQQSFQLSQAPLMRLHLLQMSENTYQFVWSFHHILLDGWSLSLVFKDLLEFYQAISQGESLPHVFTVSYRNYIAWLKQQDKSRAKEFWQQKLQGFSAPTPLTVDKPLSSREPHSGYGEEQIQLTVSTSAAIQSFARQHQLTISNLVQVTWALLLSRYSQQADVVFGATVSGRPPSLVGVESMVGLFINTLPVRVQISKNTELLSLLKDLQAQQVESEQFSYSSLIEIQSHSDVPRGTSLFESIVVFENYPVDTAVSEQANGSFSISNVQAIEQTNYPLTIVAGAGEQLSLKVSYEKSRFEHETISRMLGHFVTLLEAIVANPQQHLAQLPMLTESESRQLLVEWNDTEAIYAQDKCIHQLFEEQVARTPDAVAVMYENQQLTYGELNRRANQLAHYLRSTGVDADVLVGLSVERSLEMLVGLLGILKAGGAYVPLDPEYPIERLSFMLKDAQIQVVLTQQPLVASLPQHQGLVVCLDTEWDKIALESESNPLKGATPSNLAYVIYTSGSTGQPKGVLVNHHNVVRLFAATSSWYNFNSEDVWTLFHSIAFDFSVWEMWGALLYGGQLVVVPYLVTRSPESFYELLCQQKVTILNQTPSAFRQLIQAEQSRAKIGDLKLRLVIFGGEALEVKSLQPWFERHGDESPQLVNMYGITETTVHVTYRPLSSEDLNGTASVIGRPIPDLQVYVLDEHLQPVPIGVPGEMYVGGGGVTRGYLHRDELTALRFICDPVDNSKFKIPNGNVKSKQNSKFYKTGDLARYLPSGELEYLGRIDQQVKIRGFRIELGEIEALLAQHPAVWESVVIVPEDEALDKRLVAYVVPKVEQSPTTAELRRFLKQKLPDYMIPSAFVQLEALPLTINGKLDLRALPAPSTARPELDDVFVAPNTTEEKILASIWAKVLGVEQVGINDKFFALGGDSIRSIQVLSQAKEQGLSFSLAQLFQYQTIHELVQELKTQEDEIVTSELTQAFSLICEADKQLVPSGIEDAYPLAMLQMGMLYHTEYSKDSAIYREISSFYFKTPLDVQLLQVTLQDLINHHPVLRTSFDLSHFSIPLQLVHQQVEIPLVVEDWCHLNHSEQEDALTAWFEVEKKRHFDWTHPPLIRFFVHRRTQETFNLTLSCHHAILDGWSVASMMSELLKRYLSLLGAQVDDVSPPLSITYRDFVALEQQALASSETQGYWREKLNESTFTQLPRWSSVSKNTNIREIGVQEVTLSPEISEGLKQFAHTAAVPLKSVLLTAHLRVLNLLSGHSDVLTGLVANGRSEQSDGERVLGLFLNTLPFRLQLAGGTWIELVQQVFAAEREMLPHRRYPLAQIQRNFGGEPLFETAFNFVYFHVYEQVFGLDNLQLLGGKFFEETNFTFTVQFGVKPSSSEIELQIHYDASELSAPQMNKIGEYYFKALVAMVEQPQGRYELHSLLSVEEQQQLLVEWNDTEAIYAQDKCIHQLFEEQVARTPDAVAVMYENQQLTYGELNRRANQLAHYLRSTGVDADVLVGLSVERSLEMLVGLLGILKAGGAYVPLDPEYPIERLSFMLKDAQIQVVLTQQPLVASLPQHQGLVVCLDTEWDKIALESESNPLKGATPSNLAYVIYTSGSTGQPKGVLVNHHNVVRLFAATSSWYNFNSEDVWTLFHSIAFDFSVWEMWGALLYGGQLVVVPYLVTRSPESFYELLCQQKVTILNQTPSAFRQLIQAEQSRAKIGDLKLRLVIFGGEALEVKSLQPWFERHGDESPQLVNMYGITETTVHVTYRPLSSFDLNGTASVIGRPIPDLQVYVLDEHLQPVPIGVPGEMYVGGGGVTRGYLHRDELTALRFICDPVDNSKFKIPNGNVKSGQNAKFYKTGDLARYLPSGELEYLGRIDQQVKIRGFRIELGEIEALLAQHPAVWESVVIVPEDEALDKRLVAYVVPKVEQSPTTAELRRFLKQKLPDYMIPSAFVQLEALPLTVNGKLDLRALPAPSTARPELEDVFVAPNTTEEKILASIWAKVLGVEQVGINDKFFALGGDSIRSIQVLSQAKEQGLSFSLAQLFQYQTIHELVQKLKTQEDEIVTSELTQALSLICEADKQLVPSGIEDAYPLAMLQMGMLYHTEYSKDSAIYHDIFSFHLKTPLDVQLLQVALQDLVHHHPVLRTSFELSRFSIPLQLVRQQVEIPLVVEDWCHLNHSEQEDALTAWFEVEKKRHFDWTHPPLIRFFVHRRTQETFNLTLSFHHAILDGWSVASMMSELLKRYLSLLGAQVDDVSPPLSITYRDFVALEQQALASSDTQRYWPEKLNDSTFTKLPHWSSVPTNTNVKEVGLQEITLSPKISSGLKQFAQSAEVPLKSVLLAAHLRVLNLLSGHSDLLTGLLANGRPEQNDGERVLGLFLNTLPFRLQLAGGTWIELVQQVFAAEREILPHRRYPLAQIQRSLGGEPLFETAFNFVHFHVYQQVLGLDNLQVLDVKFFEQNNFTFIAQFSMNPVSSEVQLQFGYDALKLSPQQINRIGEYYLKALVAMVNQPQGRYELYSLLSEQEQQQLLVEWNETQADYPSNECIPDLFESQVARTPDAVAVVFEDQQLTYQELNCRANQLAHYLRSMGVRADVLVGICVERSLEMVVGLLGILKAGGAYVPLDPEYPSERRRFILEDSQLSVLLTQQSQLTKLPEHTAQLVCLDTDAQVISQFSQENPISALQTLNLAYVIYTSGSTGQPKGVQISHQAVSNFLSAMEQRPGITKQDRLLGITTIAFDIAALEIFLPITVGACLVIARREATLDGRQLLDLLVLSRATIMQATPATWRLLLEALYQESHLKILCGGEAIPWDLANQLRAVSASVWNLYGPTETTIWSSVYQLESQENLISIGSAIPNTQIYILDQNLQPVPVGVPGELYIGGASLARGYLNRPDLTVEKFIPNPFNKSRGSGEQGNRGGERLYKTGDLARYLPSGNIEYLERIDNQVKIRGFRIELGEIEATLSQHEDVQVSVVIARVDNPGDQRLVAYLVPQPEQTPTVSSLRQFLKSKLPEYMVPSAIVILESLPLTPNGKIDKRALPSPDFSSTFPDLYVAPRTPVEEIVSLIWTQVLKVERVGIHDNFFSLGGHSLLATQLISRVRTNFKVELPLRSFFAAPTVAELSQNIQQLQQQNLELSAPPIKPRELNAEIPLSFAQQRLWFLNQFEPNSPSYNIPGALRLVGSLCVGVLEQSLIEIIHRHEALRTNIITVDGKARQIIAPQRNWTLSVVDLQHLPLAEKEIARDLAQQLALQPFDLATETLLRATLVVFSGTEHVLNVCMHHVVSDGWSIGVFVEELTALYNAYSIGRPSPLLPLPIQYADFAIWQRQWLAGDVLQSQLSYWLEQLAKAPTFLPLPTDRPRRAVQTFAGASVEFGLSMELTQRLTKLSQEQGVTLFMTLLAAFDILLYRYTGQADILVGSPIANRDRTETEGLIGFFVNTLVLRTDVSDDPSFNELLPRVRSMALDAYAHQDLPFEMLLEALQLERELSHTPLFQVMFVLQNAPMSSIELTGLTISHVPIESATSKFDITLAMENTHTGLVGGWEYNTDLFDSSTIERMTQHYVTLLEAIVANPQQRISRLPMLTQSESQQLLVEWNDTLADYPQDKCIPELFVEQVALSPDAVAVVFEDQLLTYSELNCRANQLAHYLQLLGVSTDVLVGICVERSLEMLVGLLGILKAGGAYVPLDPEYPTERLRFMLEDAQVSVLLTQQELVEKLPKDQEKLVCLDEVWSEIQQHKDSNPQSFVTATDLANVIYTSGSTGKPKGVMVEHRGLCNLAQAQKLAFGLHCDSRVLQFASFSFDACIWEILMAFGSGATLYLGTKADLMPGAPLVERLRDYGITHILLPPSALAVLPLEELPVLQTLIVGGEACAVELMRQWSARRNFFNAYGPTEASVCAALAKCTPNNQKVSIGRPISNTQVYILDQNLQPVPVGVPGELYIGGAGLARGYLNRLDLTQEKFISNPFCESSVAVVQGGRAGERLYKTGDLARYLPNGNIEYLGRIDNQVKIRGFRIELGEIEAVLSQHEDVQASVVIAREDNPGNKRLVAYIVPQPEQTPTMTALRQFLSLKLPDYMVPSAIVILETLPLTPNGKIDRRALPVPAERTGTEIAIVLPRTPIEEKLALIWAQVLRVERLSIHDNFFSLGGDSILSIQIIARAKEAGLELSVKQLFANQTIASLATVAGTTKAISIEQGLITGTLPLTPIQQWFFEQNSPQLHHFNQSFLLTVPFDITPEILEQVWQKLLLHHDALRLRFTQTEGTWQQIHSNPSARIAMSRFDLSTVPDSELTKAIETTANQLQASLNLSENLVAVGFFWLGNDKRGRLLVVIHHLVVDGVSWRILLEDLQSGYEQLTKGKAIQLQSKTTSFKDWAFQLQKYAQTDILKSELAYWLRASHASVSPIPVDYATGVNTVVSASIVSVSLTETETHSLLQDVPKAYKTQINDVLLTALVLVLSSWTNSKSVLFNLEGHGREEIVDGVDLSRTVGWFTTIFPVVLKLEAIDIDNLGQALKSVKEQLRAVPHKGIGYGLLRYLNEDPEISAQLQTIPLAEISFNYLGQFTQVINTSSVMQVASESSGQSQSLLAERPNLLDINAIIANEQLQIDWAYSSNIHQHKTIEKIAIEFVETLRSLIAHCLSPSNAGYTPTDFPLVKLNQLELDEVLGRLALKSELQSYWQNIEDIYPLSPMQEGMLFESLYAPDSGVYFEQITCTFTENLDVEAFEQAWQQVVARHSIFRTAFVWESLSQPIQVVYRQVQVKIETYDWRKLSDQEQLEQLETFLDSERKEGFQLSQAPLMRLHLLQMSGNTYQFVWSHHHLLLDGWSLPLVFKDLLEFYQAISQGTRLLLQPTRSYRNYIAWLQQQDQDLAKEFWRQKLQGFTAPTPLSVDKPLSNRDSQSGYSTQQIQLTVSTSAAVQSFARQHQLTISNLVQVTWALLLCRYSSLTDVVFGATVSGRQPSLVGVESMVGLFINTLPVRVQISQKTELLSLLKDLQAQQVESEQFSYSSLVEIQGHSDVPRGTSLFESIVVFENYPVDTAVSQANGSFSISNFGAIEQTNYPLTVLAASGEQFLLKVIYDTGRFEHGTISRMLGHFVTMLEAIVANPQQHLAQLPMLTESESRQLLVEWNDTFADYAGDKCIPDLFEEQVERTPDAVAVVFENQQLTYDELNSRANQLGHYLRSLGVRADVLVGICVERSIEMVVGLLGILKAGGAYVPLDPEYPTERLRFMLEDAQVSVLLSQQHLIEKLPEQTAQLVCLDTDWQLISQSNQKNSITGVHSSNLAYVTYTSGSTGKPKGIAMNHFALGNLILWQLENPTILSGVKTLQFAPISFDASFYEMFSTWCSGGTLVLIGEELRREPLALLSLVIEQAVERLFLPLVALQQLAEVAVESKSVTSNLREIITAGEQLQITPAISNWLSKLCDCPLHNYYGPSESHIVTTFTLTNSVDTWPLLPPIGRPIANTQIYILDQYLHPVPVGVTGELYIGGACLAHGYFHRPDLTIDRFIPNPFNRSRGSGELLSQCVAEVSSVVATGVGICSERLYKTGDLARYLPDGNIEYLGRIDNQVKIRGFRIELGEIEAVLSQHEHVQASCVIARVDPTGDKRLVAYIVPQLKQTTTVSELLRFLKQKLPEYMIPRAIVILESLPLTPNGKVDRRALPAPLNPSGSDTFVSPRNTVELQLAQIWSKILKVDLVGVKDNFFDLGGHSLLAPYLMAQIKQQFGKDIPLAILFQHPTIEDLASVLQKDPNTSGWSPLVAIQPIGSNPPFFCLPGAGGNPFYLYNLARCLGSDQPFYSFQAQDQDGELAAISQVEDIAAQYLEAIQAVQPQGPYFLGGHSFGGKVAFEIAQQLLRQGEVVALVAILDTVAPIALPKPEEIDDATRLINTAKTLQIAFAKDLDMDTEPLLFLDPLEQLKYVLDYLKMLDILPPDADIKYLKRLMQAFKTDDKAFYEYVPQQVNPIAITLFRSSEFYQEEPGVLQQFELLQDSAYGWSAFSSVPVDIHFVSGNHVTMMTQPHVQILAERLKACLQQAQAKI